MPNPTNKKTHKGYVEELEQKFGSGIVVIGKYKGARVRINHRCLCGNTMSKAPTDVLAGCLHCKTCRYKATATSRVASEKDRYDSKSYKRFTRRVVRVGKYVDGYTALRHKCSHHGVFSLSPNILLANRDCPACEGLRSSASRRKAKGDLRSLASLRQSFTRIKIQSLIKNDRGTTIGFNARCPSHGAFSVKHIPTARNSKYEGCLVCARENAGSVKTKVVKVGRRTLKLQGV